MKGRKPIPTALKILRGKCGRRGEPRPRLAVPDCPPHLDDAARHEWNRLAAELHSLGMLTNLDAAMLASYCTCWSRWLNAETQLRATGGEVVRGTNGGAITSPWLGVARGALKELRSFAAELGLSPSSRSRIGPSILKPADAFEEFIKEVSR